jgi:hypothetical protein
MSIETRISHLMKKTEIKNLVGLSLSYLRSKSISCSRTSLKVVLFGCNFTSPKKFQMCGRDDIGNFRERFIKGLSHQIRSNINQKLLIRICYSEI